MPKCRKRYFVDIPNPFELTAPMICVGDENGFASKKEALAWAKMYLGCDSQGRLRVISEKDEEK